MRAILISGALVLAGLWTQVYAQDDGQFCVRSFEDRNANQVRDLGEPLLTGGVGADLLDDSGIVIASALLADSPTAAQGVICFQFLSPGQYTIQVTSAEYRATTPESMTVTLAGGELPAVLEFGAQLIASAASADTATEPSAEPDWPRIAIAGIGTVIAVLLMQLLGLLVYLLRFRRRAEPVAVKTDTGRFKPPVR